MKRSRNEVLSQLYQDGENGAARSPISELAFSISNLSSESTPKRRINWSSPSPSTTVHVDKENAKSYPDSPTPFDSPMFEEGVLKENQGPKENSSSRPRKRTFMRFRSLQVSSPNIPPSTPVLTRCHSDSEAIMKAVQKSDQNPNLVGDFSKAYSLPLVRGKHQDTKAISPDTLGRVLRGEYDNLVDSYRIIDCRYPYEYEGGHIMGAKNIYTEQGIMEEFFSNCGKPVESSNCHILIFHCEFSSERGPKLYRYLRNQDRERNKDYYPLLHYPEIYLLDGGYKAFFESYSEFCEPRNYTPMNHKEHGNELRHFRAKSKSWGGDSRFKASVRSGLKF